MKYETLLENFEYKNNDLYWKTPNQGRSLNRPAGCVKQDGYREINFDRTHYRAHRLVWCYHNGNMPTKDIDHIDGNRLNNNIENLREATHQQNMQNSKIQKNNKSGYKGVHFNKRSKKWRAKIQGKLIGSFDTPELAYEAYQEKAKIIFGEFNR